MKKILQLDNYNRIRYENYRFSIYYFNFIIDNVNYMRNFIVLKNPYGVVIKFTNYHKFISNSQERLIVSINKNEEGIMKYICVFLNYVLIIKHEKYKISSLLDINKDILLDFFSYYSKKPTKFGYERSKKDIQSCIDYIFAFLYNYKRVYGNLMLLSEEEIYIREAYKTRQGITRYRNIPNIKVELPKNRKTKPAINREITTKIFLKILKISQRYMPELSLMLAIGAFAGLRPGEIVNVSCEDVRIKYLLDSVQSIEINILEENPMRGDGKPVGQIKKPRIQKVYPSFIDIFIDIYNIHNKKALKIGDKEENPQLLFLDSRGNAMTKKTYYRRFKKLINNFVIPVLLRSIDEKDKLYAQKLITDCIAPHITRHMFSVFLVKDQQDAFQIAYWRGDKSLESAFAYLSGKEELNRELERTNDILITYLQEHGNENGI